MLYARHCKHCLAMLMRRAVFGPGALWFWLGYCNRECWVEYHELSGEEKSK